MIDLRNQARNTGDYAGDTYTNIELYFLARYADTFIGTAGVEVAYASEGNDTFVSNGGADRFYADSGMIWPSFPISPFLF